MWVEVSGMWIAGIAKGIPSLTRARNPYERETAGSHRTMKSSQDAARDETKRDRMKRASRVIRSKPTLTQRVKRRTHRTTFLAKVTTGIANEVVTMFKFIGLFLALAVCMFCAMTFLVLPSFPIVAAKFPVLGTPLGSLGVTGILCMGLVLFGKK
jgi:hypothetical protein